MHYIKKIFSRYLRKKSTSEERKVWEVLRNRRFLNLKFRRQHDLEGFIVDFYCNDLKLAVEINGKIHERQKDYDEIRQALIEEKGIKFIRVTNKEINADVNILLEKIQGCKHPPSPL